jgi:hypothetical protein
MFKTLETSTASALQNCANLVVLVLRRLGSRSADLGPGRPAGHSLLSPHCPDLSENRGGTDLPLQCAPGSTQVQEANIGPTRDVCERPRRSAPAKKGTQQTRGTSSREWLTDVTIGSPGPRRLPLSGELRVCGRERVPGELPAAAPESGRVASRPRHPRPRAASELAAPWGCR